MRLHLMGSQSKTSINIDGPYTAGGARRLQMTWACPEGKLSGERCVHQGGAWTHEVGSGHAYRHGFERIFGMNMTEAVRIPDPPPWDQTAMQDDTWQTIWQSVSPQDWARVGITEPPTADSATNDGREWIPPRWAEVPPKLAPALRSLSQNACVRENVNRALEERRQGHRADYFSLIHHNPYLPYAVGNSRGELTAASLKNAYQKVIDNTNNAERLIWNEGLSQEELRVFAPAAVNLIQGYRGCAETLCPEANRWLNGLPENQRAALGFAPKATSSLAEILEKQLASMPAQTVGGVTTAVVQVVVVNALGRFAGGQVLQAVGLAVQLGGVAINMHHANDMARLGLTTMSHDMRSTALLGALDAETKSQLEEFIRNATPNIGGAAASAASIAGIEGFVKSSAGVKIRELFVGKLKEGPVFNVLQRTHERLTGRALSGQQMVDLLDVVAYGLTQAALNTAVGVSQGAYSTAESLLRPQPARCLAAPTPQVGPSSSRALER
jgi:hypothetical protein